MLMPSLAAASGAPGPADKLDLALRNRGTDRSRAVRVIVQTTDADAIDRLVSALGGRTGRRLTGIGSVVAEVPEGALGALAAAPTVRGVSLDRRTQGTLERTAVSIGARWVADNLGFDGTGIGVAIIDSGVARAHDDLDGRVVHFVDFVDFQSQPHDGYGHGTHVAGIIAGSGRDSNGARRGIAPGAQLVVLKALDEQGDGYISNAIAALDYAIDQRAAYNIRVINLSVAAGVYESFKTDPLALAARRAVDAGIVVVTAAGNLGRNAKGQLQPGGITAPGNAPWVLTVGAASHNGTVDRTDDTVASFSSIGPSSIDFVAKPDLVAPGVGIESTADPDSTLFNSRPHARLWGTVATPTQPYLSLSGTSMAAPVVAGTVVLMLQANPALTPVAAKKILQASAEPHEAYSPAAQGAGFLNARAAVEMARTFVDAPGVAETLDGSMAASEFDGAWTASCNAAEADCRYLQEECTVAPGCFEQLAGAVVGVTAPESETRVWGIQTVRPLRRRFGHRGRKESPKRTLGPSE
jgi:serine protease AprX